nr:putative DNA binding domain-containing protein [Desulfobulbaceae bacterium]
MKLKELQQLVAKGESETLEFKKSTGQRTRIAETLCAFLNGKGGKVIIGVTDQGEIIGQTIGQGTLEGLYQEINKLEPAMVAETQKVELADHKVVLVLSVSEGQTVYTFDGRPFMRQGPTTVRMPQDHFRAELDRRATRPSPWEVLPAEKCSLDDLDHDQILTTLNEAIRNQRLQEPGHRDPEKTLIGLGLMNDSGITNGAMALFAKSDSIFADYPQCCLKMARFKGLNKNEFIDSQIVHANALELFVRGQEFLIRHLPVASTFEEGNPYRIDIPALPTLATREALANALIHRDYSSRGGSISLAVYDDRVEICNFGGLHFGMKVEQLLGPHESHLWNPKIANVFYRRKIIETWGRGTNRIIEAMQEQGLPEPIFTSEGCDFRVTFKLSASDRGAKATATPQ